MSALSGTILLRRFILKMSIRSVTVLSSNGGAMLVTTW